MDITQQEIEQANALAREGNSQAAIALLSKLIRQDSSNVEAWLALADVVDEPDRVEFCLQKVLDLDPGNLAAQERLSKIKGGSLSVGSVGGTAPADSSFRDESDAADSEQVGESVEPGQLEPASSMARPSADEPDQNAGSLEPGQLEPASSTAQPSVDEPELIAESEESDQLEHASTMPHTSEDEPEQQEAIPAAEIPAQSPPMDPSQPAQAQAKAAQAVPPPAQSTEGRSRLGRTDLILIGITVLAGIVLCALVSAALIS